MKINFIDSNNLIYSIALLTHVISLQSSQNNLTNLSSESNSPITVWNSQESPDLNRTQSPRLSSPEHLNSRFNNALSTETTSQYSSVNSLSELSNASEHTIFSSSPRALSTENSPRSASQNNLAELTQQLQQKKEDSEKETRQAILQADKKFAYKKWIMTGSVAAITLGATQIPKISTRILEQQKNDRFIGGFAIASTAIAALPTILSVAGAAYGMHQINNWVYGDVQSQIKKVRQDLEQEKNARIEGDIEAMNRLASISNTSHQATDMLAQIRPELNKLQISNRKIEEKFESIFPLMEDIQLQTQGLHKMAEIQNIETSKEQYKTFNRSLQEESKDEASRSSGLKNFGKKSVLSKLFKGIK